MGTGAPSDERDDTGNSQFGALLDRPLHAIEFEDGECYRNLKHCSSRKFLCEFELYAAVVDGNNPAAPNDLAGG